MYVCVCLSFLKVSRVYTACILQSTTCLMLATIPRSTIEASNIDLHGPCIHHGLSRTLLCKHGPSDVLSVPIESWGIPACHFVGLANGLKRKGLEVVGESNSAYHFVVGFS